MHKFAREHQKSCNVCRPREVADRVVPQGCAGRQVAPGDRHTWKASDRIHDGMVTSEAADDAEAEQLDG